MLQLAGSIGRLAPAGRLWRIAVNRSKTPASVLIVAIIAIAGLEAYALSQGHNGVLLTMAIAAIAALAGAKVGELLHRRP
jgi:hypothetical protein